MYRLLSLLKQHKCPEGVSDDVTDGGSDQAVLKLRAACGIGTWLRKRRPDTFIKPIFICGQALVWWLQNGGEEWGRNTCLLTWKMAARLPWHETHMKLV